MSKVDFTIESATANFPVLFEPKPNTLKAGHPDEYSVELILTEEEAAPIKALIDEQAERKHGRYYADIPKFWYPLIETETKRNKAGAMPDGYDRGKYILKVATRASIASPEVVDADCNPITEPKEIYSGIKCAVSTKVEAYDKGGGKGVTVYLNNFQKLADGEPITGRTSAAADFKPASQRGGAKTAASAFGEGNPAI